MFQVNRKDRLSAFSVYQVKPDILSYPILSYRIVYQSYRNVREFCSIVRVFYRIVR